LFAPHKKKNGGTGSVIMKIGLKYEIGNIAEIIAFRAQYDKCLILFSSAEMLPILNNIFKNDKDVCLLIRKQFTEDQYHEFNIHRHITPKDKELIKYLEPPLSFLEFLNKNSISEIDHLNIEGSDNHSNTFLLRQIIRDIKVNQISGNFIDSHFLELKELLQDSYKLIWIKAGSLGDDFYTIKAQWITYKKFDNDRTIKGIEDVEKHHSREQNKQLLFNIIYAHLKKGSIPPIKKGNVTVLWSSKPIKGCDLYLYNNAYSYTGSKEKLQILLLGEPSVVLPGQYNEKIWDHFAYCLTLYDELISANKNFYKILYPRSGLTPYPTEDIITEDPEDGNRSYPIENRKKGICLISGNKFSNVVGELYSKRMEAALWFALNSPLPFDVYGTPPFFLPNYYGIIEPGKKLSVLSKYKFNLCFENVNHPVFSSGYVEKILDCFETRTIPIYWGADNISEYIPKECYIDFKDFRNYGELESFLANMTLNDYWSYLNSIEKFVQEGGLRPYSWQTIYDQLAQLYAQSYQLKLSNLFDSNQQWEWLNFNTPEIPTQESEAVHVWDYLSLVNGNSPIITKKEITIRPASTDPQFFGQIKQFNQLGQYNHSFEAFSKIPWENDPELNYLLAETLLNSQNYESAARRLEMVLKLNPDHSKSYNDLAVIYYQKKDLVKTIHYLHLSVLKDPHNYTSLDNLLNLLTQLKQYDYLATYSGELIKKFPKQPEIINLLKKYNLLTDDPSIVQNRQSEDPTIDQHEILFQINLLINGGKTDKALEIITQSLADEKINSSLRLQLIHLIQKLGYKEKAFEELSQCIPKDPNNTILFHELGCQAVELKKYEEAFDFFKKAVLIDNNNKGSLQNLIQLLMMFSETNPQISPAHILKEIFNDGFYNLKIQPDIHYSKKALVVYIDDAIPWFLADRLNYLPYLNKHTMLWESTEILRLLNSHGYVVDWFGFKTQSKLTTNFPWEKYDLLLAEGNNVLNQVPETLTHLKKIFYSTGQHWLRANLSEMKRITMFRERHNILMPQERYLLSNFSDEYADYLTYFGNESQLEGYNVKVQKIPLNISCVHIPTPRSKNIKRSKKNYIWLGGSGMIHKGLDLAIDAFAELKDYTLHIFAIMHTELRFQEWLASMLNKHKNIIFHGEKNVTSPEFEEIAWNCIGSIYVSAAEGGPGSVAQLLHYGIIPIVGRTSNVRAEHLGYIIDADDDISIIKAIQRAIENIEKCTEEDLLPKCIQIQKFAEKNHTRKAYSESFNNFLNFIQK
jgi:tetratricopeptide (TPR) repeat protein